MSETITAKYTREIRAHADKIAEIHARLHRNFRLREESDEARQEWLRACEQLRTRYDQLAFPGGATSAVQRIREGDPNAMEAAVCFLEMRPYFFRSGYMYKDFLRACRHAPLSEEQHARFKQVEKRYKDWRKQKQDQIGKRL